MMNKHLFFIVLSACLLLLFFPVLFFSSTGGDTPYLFAEMLEDYRYFPSAWHWSVNNGFGGFISPYSSNHILTILITFLANGLMLPWEDIQKIVFIFPFLLLSLGGTYLLAGMYFRNSTMRAGSALLYTANTYSLMLLAGGQYVVALSYALIPVLLSVFFGLINRPTLKQACLFSVVFGLQIMFDIRFAYLTGIIMVLYLIFQVTFQSDLARQQLKKLALYGGIIVMIVLLLQSFWLLPTVLQRENPLEVLGSAFVTEEAVSFFSFSQFEYAFSLYHPNWPKNIFGVTDFFRAEFLLVPFLAFSSLFFMKNISNKKERLFVLFLTLVGLVGAFLAKGSNEPFGNIYLFMFDSFPGFQMFRDPTKWYALIALSYALLIPFTLMHVYSLLIAKLQELKHFLPYTFSIVTICMFVFLLRFGFTWSLPGTFQPTTVPDEFKRLTSEISNEEFYRTLWVPTVSRFTYASSNHPAVSAYSFYKTTNLSDVIRKLEDPSEAQYLREAGIKYVIIPYDSEHEIFLTDRKFDPILFSEVVNRLEAVPYLRRNTAYNDLLLFEVQSPKGHFWSPNPSLRIDSVKFDPTRYALYIHNSQKGDRIIMNEAFSSMWGMKADGFITQAVPYSARYSSFLLPKRGSYQVELFYKPQYLVVIGSIISVVTLIFLFFFIFKPVRRKDS